MNHTVDAIRFEMPDDFAADEVMMSFRAPPPKLKAPLSMNKQLAVRPNLIVHRRPIANAIELVCGEICAELVSSIPGLENLATSRCDFSDGAMGMLVLFDFPAGNDARVRHYQAMRIDEGMLTTLSLNVDGTLLDQDTHAHYVKLLSSAAFTGKRAS